MFFTRNKRCFGLVVLLLLMFFTVWAAPSEGMPDGQSNILIFWTDRDRLKAITLVTAQGCGNPLGIVAIPVHIRINEGEQHFTIAETYARVGREGLTCRLEQLFQTPIGNYLIVDQSTLEKASRVLGPIIMNGRTTSLAEVFEGSYTEGEVEPQTEVRALAARLVEPKALFKAPQVIMILSTEVMTNLGYRNIWDIYLMVEYKGPGIINKRALTGRDFYVGSFKYREVAPEAWGRALNDVTRV